MQAAKMLTETRRALRQRAAAHERGPYRFSITDALLHAAERSWETPPMAVRDVGNAQIVEIGGYRVHWPPWCGADDLPWLWNESFVPAWRNPSSYDAFAGAYSDLDWAIDAGACEGFFTLHALEKGTRFVVAVEPVAEIAACLGKTLEVPVATGRVTVRGAALGACVGRSSIGVNVQHACESGEGAGTGAERREVAVTTLDALISELGLAGTGLVKMDVEGAEMDVLAGGRDCLRKLRPALAIAVYHGVDNAMQCHKIVTAACPDYRVRFRGMWAWEDPPRPQMLFAAVEHVDPSAPARSGTQASL